MTNRNFAACFQNLDVDCAGSQLAQVSCRRQETKQSHPMTIQPRLQSEAVRHGQYCQRSWLLEIDRDLFRKITGKGVAFLSGKRSGGRWFVQ